MNSSIAPDRHEQHRPRSPSFWRLLLNGRSLAMWIGCRFEEIEKEILCAGVHQQKRFVRAQIFRGFDWPPHFWRGRCAECRSPVAWRDAKTLYRGANRAALRMMRSSCFLCDFMLEKDDLLGPVLTPSGTPPELLDRDRPSNTLLQSFIYHLPSEDYSRLVLQIYRGVISLVLGVPRLLSPDLRSHDGGRPGPRRSRDRC